MTTITKIIQNIQSIINLMVPLVFAVAFIVFIYGVFNFFILGGGNEEKRAQGRQFIMYGIIAFAVMVSVWGLVNVVTGTLNLSNNAPCLPTLAGPCTPTTSSSHVTPNTNLLSPSEVNQLQIDAAKESGQPAVQPSPLGPPAP